MDHTTTDIIDQDRLNLSKIEILDRIVSEMGAYSYIFNRMLMTGLTPEFKSQYPEVSKSITKKDLNYMAVSSRRITDAEKRKRQFEPVSPLPGPLWNRPGRVTLDPCFVGTGLVEPPRWTPQQDVDTLASIMVRESAPVPFLGLARETVGVPIIQPPIRVVDIQRHEPKCCVEIQGGDAHCAELEEEKEVQLPSEALFGAEAEASDQEGVSAAPQEKVTVAKVLKFLPKSFDWADDSDDDLAQHVESEEEGDKPTMIVPCHAIPVSDYRKAHESYLERLRVESREGRPKVECQDGSFTRGLLEHMVRHLPCTTFLKWLYYPRARHRSDHVIVAGVLTKAWRVQIVLDGIVMREKMIETEEGHLELLSSYLASEYGTLIYDPRPVYGRSDRVAILLSVFRTLCERQFPVRRTSYLRPKNGRDREVLSALVARFRMDSEFVSKEVPEGAYLFDISTQPLPQKIGPWIALAMKTPRAYRYVFKDITFHSSESSLVLGEWGGLCLHGAAAVESM